MSRSPVRGPETNLRIGLRNDDIRFDEWECRAFDRSDSGKTRGTGTGTGVVCRLEYPLLSMCDPEASDIMVLIYKLIPVEFEQNRND
jgi:hypothetical protein